MSPAVTVLMPVFNGEPFVHDAIASILGQTWTDFELVIVDDGSTDGTAAVIDSFHDARIRVIRNRSREGLPRALNRGLAAASAPIVARQDADDISHPTRLEIQLAFLRANPEVVLVGAQVRVLVRGRPSHAPGWWRALTHSGIRFQSMFENPFIHTTVVFRRDVVGGYDPELVSGEDFELWSRVAAHHPVRNLPQTLVDFRMHPASTAAHFGSDHIARHSMILERNLRSVLALPDVPEAWSRLLSSMQVNPGVRGARDGRELLAVVDQICERYRISERGPEVRAPSDVRRVAAAKFAQIACVLAPCGRRAALRAFGRAARFEPSTASTFATRFFALLVFGDRVRTWRRR